MPVTSLAELAKKVGCAGYPERWDGLFPEVLAEFQNNGCRYTDPDFYTELNRKYGILTKHLPIYRKAAEEVGKDEDLSLFLAVVCRALQDREYHKEDLKNFSQPVSQQPNLAIDMFTALAIASEADMCYRLLTARNLPKMYVDQLMLMPESGVDDYMDRHNGRPGYSLLGWNQLAIDGKLFRIGRLEFEFDSKFNGRACVFENREGRQVALANEMRIHRSGNTLKSKHFEDEHGSWTAQIEETDTYWQGNPITDRGLVEDRLVRLDKGEWKKILSRGDTAINIHIPSGGGLTPEAISQTICAVKEFAATYYPDYDYKAFFCHSWLMDPQLGDLLGPDANITKFMNLFKKVTLYSKGEAVFNFVFLKPDMNFALEDLPENTRLERSLKAHYLSGKAIYEIVGYFF